jgi:hypothetical protein
MPGIIFNFWKTRVAKTFSKKTIWEAINLHSFPDCLFRKRFGHTGL